MGAGASTDYPEKLSEEQIKEICGDKYVAVLYRSVRDVDGFVSRDDFIKVVTDSVEREVVDVFNAFCHNGGMDSRTFAKLCREARLLNKAGCTATDCDVMFQKAKSQHAHGSTKANLQFSEFRNALIPALAEKRQLEEHQVLAKIAEVEAPHLHGTQAESVRLYDDKKTFTGIQAHSSTPTPEQHDDKHKAALKIQTIHRQKSARRKVNAAKEVKLIATTQVNPDTEFSKPDESAADEITAMGVFMKFTPNGEIDSRHFVKLCKDAGILEQKFTANDADIIFQKTKAKACAPGADAYRSGVLHGKRFGYSIFRMISVPMLAEKKGVSQNDILLQIAHCPGPSMNHVTAAQDTHLHHTASTEQ